ncbi:hypothetical protein B0H16DRAFT_1723421 [Mycena metata]|uniref:Uncharacterized protein n=1 Tax=Mycena metata TaxID=1033252 RepID=A0AAD7IY88_9AGAR|nr:hypothetical protein B0H16DRAFT_1723421 [Mycena metata]
MSDADPIEVSDGEPDVAGDLSDTNLDGQLQAIMNQPHLQKWSVMSPSLMKKKQKEAERKAKKAEKKRERLDADDDEPKSKRAKKQTTGENDDSALPPAELTGYIHVLKAVPTLPSRSRAKTKPEDLYVKRGPFKFMSNCSFAAFSNAIAQALPCPPAHIALGKTEWKPQTPANRAPLPPGGADGFDVLQKQIRKTKDMIVILTMPGPQKPAEDAPFWETKDDNDSTAGPLKKQEFDFASLETSSSEQSVEEQKVSFDKAVTPHVEALKEQWPENDAGQRIYTDEKGFQWDLTPIRLNIWVCIWCVTYILFVTSLICIIIQARGTATVGKAPLSTQFDIKYRIKQQPAVANPFPAQAIPAAPPAVSAAADKLLEMMMQQQQMQQQQLHPPYYPPHSCPIGTVVSYQAQSPYVSLDEFCTYYSIAQHLQGLEKLGYEPGDKGMVALEREDWYGVAGFGKLTWDKILVKHRQFLKDAQAGLWL